jgi:hypothetical protein
MQHLSCIGLMKERSTICAANSSDFSAKTDSCKFSTLLVKNEKTKSEE